MAEKKSEMHFSLKRLLDFQGNRYELARACMEYAKKVRYLQPEDYHSTGEKDALVAMRSVLDGNIHYTLDPVNREEIIEFEDFDNMPQRQVPPTLTLGEEDDDEEEDEPKKK
jgi:DNA-directed RNA polymerase subunit K/omega